MFRMKDGCCELDYDSFYVVFHHGHGLWRTTENKYWSFSEQGRVETVSDENICALGRMPDLCPRDIENNFVMLEWYTPLNFKVL